MWHIDTTVIRLLDGTRAYLHAVIDNFSRRILAFRVAELSLRTFWTLLRELSSHRHRLPVVLDELSYGLKPYAAA